MTAMIARAKRTVFETSEFFRRRQRALQSSAVRFFCFTGTVPCVQTRPPSALYPLPRSRLASCVSQFCWHFFTVPLRKIRRPRVSLWHPPPAPRLARHRRRRRRTPSARRELTAPALAFHARRVQMASFAWVAQRYPACAHLAPLARLAVARRLPVHPAHAPPAFLAT